MHDLTTGSPFKGILNFMIPILMGNLLQLTYSIADTRITGTYLGDEALAAVGATTVLYSLFTGFFMGIANGFAILTAQHYGAKKMGKVKITFAAAIFLGLSLALLLVFLTVVFLNPILHFLNVPAHLYSDSYHYIIIVLFGMVVTMFYDILLASSRAIGDSVTPLIILILSVCLNIFLDILFLGVFHSDVTGAAYATVGAQFFALAVCLIYLLIQYDIFRVSVRDFLSITPDLVIHMLTMGLSMGFMSSLISFGSLILQTAINDLGSSYIVAQTAARKVTELLMSIFIAMGQTLATYCGQNYGAGQYKRIREGMNVGYLVTCLWCVAVLGIVYLFSQNMIILITGSDDSVMIEAASHYLKTDCILYFLVAIIFVQRNSLQGIGDRITPLISSGIEMAGKILLTLTLVPYLKYTGVILVEPIVWIFMIIPLNYKWKRLLRGEEWQN